MALIAETARITGSNPLTTLDAHACARSTLIELRIAELHSIITSARARMENFPRDNRAANRFRTAVLELAALRRAEQVE